MSDNAPLFGPRMQAFLIVFWLLMVAITGGVYLGYKAFISPRDWATPLLWIPQGQSTPAIASSIARESGLNDLLIKAYVRAFVTKPLQAGEYDLADRPPVALVIARIQNGKFIKRSITIPEGLTSFQIIEKLKTLYGLTVDCPDWKTVPEGSLLPETYAYVRGETCTALLGRMKSLMDKAAADMWPQRDPSLPYKDWNEAVTMASIVERETGVAAERPRVAGVFVNRLRLGMPMQSDPTTIYALSGGTGVLGRELTRADWKVPHAYNTYTIPALPPGPIAHPGKASLQAALHPETNDFLFFVTNGTGGHAFAKTLDQHDRNVSNK